jgi:1,4-alpha-glucan branching enzyme
MTVATIFPVALEYIVYTLPFREPQVAQIPMAISLSQAQTQLLEGRLHDPFAVLGPHSVDDSWQTCAHLPMAEQAWVLLEGKALVMDRLGDSKLFNIELTQQSVDQHYQLRWRDAAGEDHTVYDPYSFATQLSDFDLHLFGEGKHWHIYRLLGAHRHQVDGIDGVLFATWAPNAERVSVVGEFNNWDGRCHPMRVRGSSGVWELFIPQLADGQLYKFELRNREHGSVQQKADPYAQQSELRPNTASIISCTSEHQWQDQAWLQQRRDNDWLHSPMSVYEVHLGSWQRSDSNGFLNYRELAHRLVAYVSALGFTHIELLPITEHPFDDSWGYQTTGYFAPSARFGSPDDFRYLVDYCHQHHIGVLLDWVPAHFPRDAYALAQYDGAALYEHADPQRGEHRDWGTLIYDYGRREVSNFLLASANFWLEEFHLDGLRVDAVASLIYLDYSREDGQWTPNIHGGNENLEAVAFLRELNALTHGEHPGTLTIAEESTSWPLVTGPVWLGGLGFSMKWNMGWMNDSLQYMSLDPVFRKFHHDQLTFGLMYAFSENFALPFSHDEVVHGKGSMIGKMPGDEWQRFANLRLLYTFLFTYPGTKLLFMGDEFAQLREWSAGRELDWPLLEQPLHQGICAVVGDLNRLYRNETSLYYHSFSAEGFQWIDCHDSTQSVISYLRKDGDNYTVVVLNFTPEPRSNYRIGVPQPGSYRELFNSDSEYYGGSNVGNGLPIESDATPWMGFEHSIPLTLPPLGGLILQLQREEVA